MLEERLVLALMILGCSLVVAQRPSDFAIKVMLPIMGLAKTEFPGKAQGRFKS